MMNNRAKFCADVHAPKRIDYVLVFASVPSPEDKMIARAAKQETGELFSDLIHHLIDRSPKHGLAALLLLNGSKGAKFQEKMHLGHDAANTVRKQSIMYPRN